MDNCGKSCHLTGPACGGGGASASGGGARTSGAGNPALNAAIAPQASVQGKVIGAIGDAVPQQDMSGVARTSDQLDKLLRRTVSAQVPTGVDPSIASQGAVPYLRPQGDDAAAVNRRRSLSGNEGLASAKAMMGRGDVYGAKDKLTSMITLDPRDYRALARRAEVFNHLKRYKEAEADARKSLSLDPDNAVTWSQLSWALLKQGRYKEALTAIERAILASPENGNNYAIRAFIKYVLGDHDGALQDMETAAKLDPQYVDRLEAFKKGAKLYDLDEDNDSMLGLTAGLRPLSGWILFALLAAMSFSLLAGVAYSSEIKGWLAGLTGKAPSDAKPERLRQDERLTR